MRFYVPFFLFLVTCTILLTLPGSAFPKKDWLDGIWFDKWVHIGLFSLLTLLFCWAFYKTKDRSRWKQLFVWSAVLMLVYGIGMEFIQKYFVANRSFDNGDIIADAVGSMAGLAFSWWRYIKK